MLFRLSSGLTRSPLSRPPLTNATSTGVRTCRKFSKDDFFLTATYNQYIVLRHTVKHGRLLDAWTTQLRKGLTELIVLAALKPSEAYGYELLQRVNGVDGLTLTESTVYPLLAKLKRNAYVTVRAVPSTSGPPRRYYRLTKDGQKRLLTLAQQWADVSNAVNLVLEGQFDD